LTDRQIQFTIKLVHLLPQVWALSFAGILSFWLSKSDNYYEALTIFPETPTGASLNSLLFILPLLFAATMMYLLIRSGLLRVVRFLVKSSLATATFLLLTWYVSKAVKLGPTTIFGSDIDSAIFSVSLTALALFMVYRKEGVGHSISMASIGSLIGVFLAFSIPMLSAIVLLAALVAYDVLSVYKGPIGKIVENSNIREFTGAVITMRDVTVGMGDMVFYCMLAAVAFSNLGILSYVMSSLGVLFGAYAGMRMLEEKDYFPGLPLALACGLIMMFGSILLAPLVAP
jgi:hypothetical protein